MRAILLAAGMGSRLKEYTVNKPKAMLEFGEQSLATIQLDKLRKLGVRDVAVVGGHCQKKLDVLGIPVFVNSAYKTTNMIESLVNAKEWLTEDTMIVYGDIWCSSDALQMIMDCHHNDALAVDSEWRDYWHFRYGSLDTDLEQLEIDQGGFVRALGRELDSSETITHRYVGLIKLSQRTLRKMFAIYEARCAANLVWRASGMTPRQGYLTDILDEMIHQQCCDIKAVDIKRRWLEFDTNEDYEKVVSLLRNGTLCHVCPYVNSMHE